VREIDFEHCMKKRTYFQIRSLRLIGILLIPSVWFFAADVCEFSSPLLLPSLGSVCHRIVALINDGTMFLDLSSTLRRWFFGFSIGIISGIMVGLMFGVSTTLRSIVEFPLEFLRAMPVTPLFPLFLIIFGIGDSSKIAMAFMPTFLLMIVNTSYGVTLSDPTKRRMAAVFGASSSQIFRTIVALEALPQIFVGLRLALAQSLIVTVVSEMFIGTDFGIGQRVYDSYLTNSVTSLYALLAVLGVIGYLSNRALLALESYLVSWAGQ
jgi:ABC-type nitrate/sulfonate/bicarbonate transport system permease component